MSEQEFLNVKIGDVCDVGPWKDMKCMDIGVSYSDDPTRGFSADGVFVTVEVQYAELVTMKTAVPR